MIKKSITGLFVFLCFYSVSLSKVWINEVMSSNQNTIADEDGDFSDWIELYNSGNTDIDLTGMYLSDDEKKLNKWTFPYIIIPANGHLLIWASGKDKIESGGRFHANFSISADGEELILTGYDGIIIDSIGVPAISGDQSYARIPDGSPEWFVSDISTPGEINIYSEVLAAPRFSRIGGFYQQGFNLELTHSDPQTIILYTLDGSEPILEHLNGFTYQYKNRYKQLPIHTNGAFIDDQIKTFQYTAALEIKNRTSAPIDAAKIPTTFEFIPDHIPTNTQNVFKGTVVKARAYKEGVGYSPLIAHTYFVHPNGRSKYSLPVISLSTSKEYLFDYEKGIYVAGKDFDDWRRANQLTAANPSVDANYQRRGDTWEYPVHFEYFENAQNTAVINQTVGFRIHGGWTRAEAQKGLRIYARKEYGESNIEYPLFSQTEQDVFKRLILKNTFNFRVVDDVYQNLVRHLDFPTQSSGYAAVFINGEYWGLHEVKERFDKHYLANKYGVDPDNLDYLSNDIEIGEGDDIYYKQLLHFMTNNSLESDANYQYIANRIDVSNYIDYQIAEIYSSNRDWPHNNIDFWRVRTDSVLNDVPYGHDGKWRWMLYDLDMSMNGIATTDSFTHNTLEWASRDHSSTVLFRNLIKNASFSEKFITRFADLLNTTFVFERVSPFITNDKSHTEKFFPEHLARWDNISGGTSRLNSTYDRMMSFARNRVPFVRNHIQNQFSLKAQIQLTLNVSHSEAPNYIRINTINIQKSTVGVSEMPYPWKGVYFHGVPVEITAIAAPGYEFSHWEGMPEGTPVSFIKDFDTHTVLTAHFKRLALPEFSVKYTSGMGGYLEGDSIQSIEQFSDGSMITAISSEGYEFTSWSDGRTENPRTEKNVQQDINVQAIFSKIVLPEYSLTYTSGEGGYLEGDSMQTIEKNKNGSAVTAIPSDGYQFQSWSDGSTENPRTDNNIQGNLSVQAIFGIVTGIDEKQKIFSRIYPNPAGQTLTIEIQALSHLHFSIMHINGQQIQSGSLNTKTQVIDISSLPTSVYILWIKGEDGQSTYHKFIKN